MSNLSIWNPLRRISGLADWRSASPWSPLRQLESVQQRMDELFRDWPTTQEGKEALTVADWSPACDITEDDKEYLVKAELPDVKKEDVKVTVEDGTLCISGERKSEKEEKGKKYHRIERSYGRFERSFALPTNADPKKISSTFKNGVLEVHLTKGNNGKPKAVEVKVQ